MTNDIEQTAEDAENAEGRRVPAAELNSIGDVVVDSALRVHTSLGPGLLESAYEVCLIHELTKRGLRIRRQVALPVVYDGQRLDAGFRIDVLVDELVVLEIKAVEMLTAVHTAQLLSYLRLGKFRLGYLLNFNVNRMKDGIRRLVNDL